MTPAHTPYASELELAIVDERVVNAKAWALGFYSTQPLSPVRIIELCRLGDEMIRATARRQLAECAEKPN